MAATQTNAAGELEGLARQLVRAQDDLSPIAPLSEQRPGLTIDDAYAIQGVTRALRLDRGGRLVGHKVGLTSKAMQELVGVDQPDYGYVLDTHVHDDGAHVGAEHFIAPRIEGEVAFRLARRVTGADVSAADVLAATEAVAPALEIIDSRIQDWRLTIIDTIADNASSGGGVLGSWMTPADLEVDLAELEMQVTVGSEAVDGQGAAVLGHPAESVAWLARALHAQGEALEAGQVVLSGALARALPIAPGGTAQATFGPLGSVRATF